MIRHRERTRHSELMMGILAATIVNHSFSPPKGGVSPAHFMPSQQLGQPTKKRRKPRKLIAQNIRCFLMGQIENQRAANAG